MKKFVCGLMAVGLALTGCGSQSSTKDKADVKIGVINICSMMHWMHPIRDLRILL